MCDRGTVRKDQGNGRAGCWRANPPTPVWSHQAVWKPSLAPRDGKKDEVERRRSENCAFFIYGRQAFQTADGMFPVEHSVKETLSQQSLTEPATHADAE